MPNMEDRGVKASRSAERIAFSKLVSVVLASALSAIILVGLPLGMAVGTVVEGAIFASLAVVVGVVLGALIGFPAVLMIDKLFPRSRHRHVLLAPVCAVLAWLVIEGAFARGAWHQIWTSSSFWSDWAPRRMAAAIVLGLVAGGLYTIICPRVLGMLGVNKAT